MATKAALRKLTKGYYALALARISIGLICVWAFLDKVWGLGFSTCRDAKSGVVTLGCSKAWINGGSPTVGFLKNAAKGPFKGFFNSLSGHTWVDWAFMLGLLLIGMALVTGIGVKIASITGSLLFLMMWSAALWPATNPALDDHIVYIFVLAAIYFSNAEQKLGFGQWWKQKMLVQKYSILE